ncbi:flavodoxin domain-containing protein [Desulfosarcina variabilis]|uniref:flavodoxin domain-containing protein n=1 Tax=Desulfosarcina variabilis TaxID=2300 RepID=UPI003AFA0358
MKTLIICASRYGSTMEIGRWISERLPGNDVALFHVDDAPDPDEYEFILLGGGVYNEHVDKTIVQYAETHLAALEGKKIAIFAVCMDTRGVYMKGRFWGGWLYLNPLLEALGNITPIYADILHGEISPKKLSEKDHALLMHFYTKILNRDVHEVPYRTLMNKAEVWKFVEKTMARIEGKY